MYFHIHIIENKHLLDYLFNKYEEFNDNQKVFITNYEKLIIVRDDLILEEGYMEASKEVISLIKKHSKNVVKQRIAP